MRIRRFFNRINIRTGRAEIQLIYYFYRVKEHIKHEDMGAFGIVTFLLIGGMAFWMLLFLLGFVVPFWITLGVFEKLQPKRIQESEDTEG